MSTHEKREKMLSVVADWKASGLTQKAFGLLHNINVATLGYWVARSKEQESSTKGFIELPSRESVIADQVEIIYPTGVRLKVSSDISLISNLSDCHSCVLARFLAPFLFI